MPKKLVIKSDSSAASASRCAYNAASALAEAIGSTVVTGTDSYSVSFESVGYPDLSFEIQPSGGSSGNETKLISKTSVTQLNSTYWLVNNGATPANNAISCYVVRDSNNDTILVGLHTGTSELSSFNILSAPYVSRDFLCLFMGRDVNENVIWGNGIRSIQEITNGSNIINFKNEDKPSDRKTFNHNFPPDILQFVKMRNYLEDGFPEMKTAYVTVLRTIAKPSNPVHQRANLSFYADGALWGYAGTDDWYNTEWSIDPFVKY